jgi:DNA polymerase-3 subunit gamma/tau
MGYLSEVLRRGFEGDDFILGLCEHFRNLLFAKNTDTLRLMEVSDTLRGRYLDQTALAPDTFLINCLYLGNQCDVNYKQSKNKRLSVELALIKMCYVNSTVEAAGASKKKLSTVETQDIASPPTTMETQNFASLPTATTRPASAPPKPIPDRDNVTKKSAKLLSLDDISDTPLRVNKNEAEDNPVTLSATIREFNQENITELWHSFATSIRETKGGVSALMNLYLPQVPDGATITVSLESELQKSQFTQIMSQLKNFIYSHIGFHPDIQVAVIKSPDSTQKYYTPQDKLKKLIELNPALRRFQKELGLDLDYD